MSVEASVTRDDLVFAGEDKTLRFTAYADAAKTVCEDASAFALSWKLSTKPGGTDLVTKTTTSGISVSGTFNSDPALNTQRIVVSLADTDTDGLKGTYYHELKRTDPGLEAVLAQGKFYLHPPVHTS